MSRTRRRRRARLALTAALGVVVIAVAVAVSRPDTSGGGADPAGRASPTTSLPVAGGGERPTTGPAPEGGGPPTTVDPPVAPAPAEGVEEHHVPASVPGAPTCAADAPDATAALQEWLDGLPTGDVVARLAPGLCYRVEGTVELLAKDGFALDGRGATLRAFTPGAAAAQRTRAHLSVSGSTDVAITDLVVDGGDETPREDGPDEPPTAATEAQHGVRIDGVTDPGDPRRGPNVGVMISDVRVDRVRGDGVYVRASSDVVVRGATLGSSGRAAGGGLGRHGVAVVSGERIVIVGSIIANPRRAVLDIEPNVVTDTIRAVAFRDNDVVEGPEGPPGLTFVANGGADAVIDGVSVVGNRLWGKELWIVASPPHPDGFPYGAVTEDAVPPDPADPGSYRRERYVIEGNVSDTPTLRSGASFSRRGAAIYLGGVHGVRVRDNVVPLGSPGHPSEPMALVHLRDVRGAVIAANDLPAVDGDGAGDGVVEFEGPSPCGSGNRTGWPLTGAGGLPSC